MPFDHPLWVVYSSGTTGLPKRLVHGHGDWVKFTSRGSGVILGRSDSTINRLGVRMGSSEIYAVVEELTEVIDSLVVGFETSQCIITASCAG